MGLGDLIKDNLPGLPEIPDADGLEGPSITDFNDFSTFTACTEKQAVFTAKTLKLQSVLLTARLQIVSIRGILRPMLGIDNDLVKIPEMGEYGINLDANISKITAPKVNPLPKCLADTLTGDVVQIAGGMDDILDPFNTGIDTINSLTSSASGMLNSASKSFTDNVNNGVNAVNKLMEKTMGNIIAVGDKPLFVALEKFQKFVDGTNFIETYKDWKDIHKCLEKNCKPLAPYLIGKEFLYYDEEFTQFIMPIYITSGKIKIANFFEDLTPEEIIEAGKIQARYYKYLSDKQIVLANAARKAKEGGVKDDKNPFSKIASSALSDTKSTFNNLF